MKRSRAERVGDLGSGGELVFRGVFGLKIGLGCLDGGVCSRIKVEVGCGVEVCDLGGEGVVGFDAGAVVLFARRPVNPPVRPSTRHGS